MPYTSEGIGYQKTDTSKEAATTGRNKLTIRARVKLFFEERPHAVMTTQFVSKSLEIPECTIRPRFSELKNDGVIKDSGKRARTEWGKSCIMWELVKKNNQIEMRL